MYVLLGVIAIVVALVLWRRVSSRIPEPAEEGIPPIVQPRTQDPASSAALGASGSLGQVVPSPKSTARSWSARSRNGGRTVKTGRDGWVYSGRRTTEDAFITLLWAVAERDPEALSKSAFFDPEATQLVKRRYEELSPADRDRYRSAEGYCLATYGFALFGLSPDAAPAHYRLLGQERKEASVTIRAVMYLGNEEREVALPLVRTSVGWVFGPVTRERLESLDEIIRQSNGTPKL